MGRPYPGHRIAADRRRRQARWRRRDRRGRGAPDRARRHARSRLLPRVLRESGRHRAQVHRRLVPHRRPRQVATPTATSGTRAAPTTCSRPPATGSGRRRSRTASSGTRRSPTPRSFPSPDETRGNVVKAFIVLAAGHAPSPALEDDICSSTCASYLAPYEYPEGDRVHRRAADDDHRQGAAARAARARTCEEDGLTESAHVSARPAARRALTAPPRRAASVVSVGVVSFC